MTYSIFDMSLNDSILPPVLDFRLGKEIVKYFISYKELFTPRLGTSNHITALHRFFKQIQKVLANTLSTHGMLTLVCIVRDVICIIRHTNDALKRSSFSLERESVGAVVSVGYTTGTTSTTSGSSV